MDFHPLWDYNEPMNNMFIEGPVQTGKSTTIRKVLNERFGPDLKGVAGFTSQRITDADGHLLAFRLAPAEAKLSIAADPDGLDNIFKRFTQDGPVIDLDVFETTGVAYLEDALAKAKAGQASLVLLDEIGGHEMNCETFCTRLYELLDSDIPCVGVVKSPDNTKRMDPTLLQRNEELHAHLTVTTGLETFEPLFRQFLDSIL